MDRRILVLVLSIMVVLLLAGCSAVFEAGISGKVVTKSGTSSVPVADVNVFAYTDKSLRDSDLAKFKAGTITRPSEGSGYVATTSTNNNGQFVVNKIVWETKRSKFGKTADVNKLYLIFYHEDYEVASDEATIISGSTNEGNVYINLKGSKDYTTLDITVYDAATERAMTTECTLKYYIGTSTEGDTVQITGNSRVSISYPSSEEGTSVRFVLSAPGTFWKMTDKDGHQIEELQVDGVKKSTHSVRLYMKNHEFVVPTFSGSVILGSGAGYEHFSLNDKPSNKNDDVAIGLEYKPVSGEDYVPFVEIKDKTKVRDEAVGENIRYYHGEFSGEGYSGITVRINDDEDNPYRDAVDWDAYASQKNVTLKLRLVFGDGTKHKDFDYSINDPTALGTIDLSE